MSMQDGKLRNAYELNAKGTKHLKDVTGKSIEELPKYCQTIQFGTMIGFITGCFGGIFGS